MNRPRTFGALARAVVVAVILVFYIGTTLPDVVQPWHPTGDFGFTLDAARNVTTVEPKRSAVLAGVRVGDRNDFAATPVDSLR